MSESKKTLRKEFKEKTVGYMLAAFGLVAGLAWNDAIKAMIDTFIIKPGNGIFLKFLYAAVVTVIIVLISFYLLKLTQDKEEVKK